MAAHGQGRGTNLPAHLHALEVSHLARREVVARNALRTGLTRREAEIVDLLVEGRPWHEVADALGISRRTYGTHVSHILRKTGADSIGSLVISLLLEAQQVGVRAARAEIA
jgi:DNA-binding CsgD family transcriptional regulator